MFGFSQKIESYGVTVERSIKANGTASNMTRFIDLNLQVIGEKDVANMLVSFHDPWDGSIGNLHFPRLPMEDYEDAYKILQTEKPVYVRVFVGEKDKLRQFAISTDQKEPTGEGLRDESP